MQSKKKIIKIEWKPQPRQLECLRACGLSYPFDLQPLHKALADIIGYGGAAGGGKTDTLLAIGIVASICYPGINIGYFRREFPQLEGAGGAIQRSRALISHFASYNEQRKRWEIPTGKYKKDRNGQFILDQKGQKIPNYSYLQFNHCKDPNDVYNYLSQQFDILLIDESTQFEKEMIKLLITRNRATVTYSTFAPFTVLATNPGNIGHQYFKDEFVSLGTPGQVNVFINESGQPEKHLFIPSKLADNQILEKRDPMYRQRLGSTELNRKIYLEGNWDVFAGQAFSELSRDVHIIEPVPLQPYWRYFGAYDHGFNHPYSFGIFAVDEDGIVYRIGEVKDRLKRVDEIAVQMENLARIVFKDVFPNQGLNKLAYIVAGHDCWARGRDGGPTVADQFFSRHHILFRRASIDRVQGVNQLRYFLSWKGKGENGSNGKPRFFMFRTAASCYDTLARMIFDTQGPQPEDVLKVDADENGYGGDDQYDEVRYGLMSRPRAGVKAKTAPPKNSFQAYMDKMERDKYLKENYVGYN